VKVEKTLQQSRKYMTGLAVIDAEIIKGGESGYEDELEIKTFREILTYVGSTDAISSYALRSQTKCSRVTWYKFINYIYNIVGLFV